LVDQAAGAEVTGGDLNFDDVARLGDGGAGRGAGEDDVALLEGEQLGQVRHEPGEREEQVLGGVVLDQFAVVPGADAKGAGSTASAGISAGPTGVKPSPPLDRRLEPLSA
jgi:hypothetical protein